MFYRVISSGKVVVDHLISPHLFQYPVKLDQRDPLAMMLSIIGESVVSLEMETTRPSTLFLNNV